MGIKVILASKLSRSKLSPSSETTRTLLRHYPRLGSRSLFISDLGATSALRLLSNHVVRPIVPLREVARHLLSPSSIGERSVHDSVVPLLMAARSGCNMPYVPTSTTGFRTVTVTHTVTNTMTAIPTATQSSADAAIDRMGTMTNVLTLVGFAISLTGFAFKYNRGLPSGPEIERWRKLVKKWNAWMDDLSPDMKQHIMRDNPTLIKQLEDDLARYGFLVKTIYDA